MDSDKSMQSIKRMNSWARRSPFLGFICLNVLPLLFVLTLAAGYFYTLYVWGWTAYIVSVCAVVSLFIPGIVRTVMEEN